MEPDSASACPGCPLADRSGVQLVDLAVEDDRRPAASRASTGHRSAWPPLVGEREPWPTASRHGAKDWDVPTALQLYFGEIQDDALLTAAEEYELAGAIARGE